MKQYTFFSRIILTAMVFTMLPAMCSIAQDAPVLVNPDTGREWPLFPAMCSEMPDISSPYRAPNGQVYLVAQIDNETFAVFTVTPERRGTAPGSNHPYFKGDQLMTDDLDFPTLLTTGLHDEQQLMRKADITGRFVAQISQEARPAVNVREGVSEAGFIALEEDIISVLLGDNRLVSAMGLTHAHLADALFHVWNMVLMEYDLGSPTRHHHGPGNFYYNGNLVTFRARGSRGYQETIFGDEIRGAFEFWLERALSGQELEYMRGKYPDLSQSQFEEMTAKLSSIHTGEMVAYYIKRYGFYEGHTAYRADPVAMAWVFGFRTIEQLEEAFPGQLHHVLTQKFTWHTTR